MARPCHPLHADLQATGACHWCDLYRRDAGYRALWDGTPAPAAVSVPGPCVHLGDPTGEVRECGTCSGRVRLKVRACAVHGSCTEGRPVAGLAFCGACPDRRPA